MNRNAVYLAVFAVLCVLAGVLVGASLTRGKYLPGHGFNRGDFRAKAEHFMGYSPAGHKEMKGGPLQLFTERLNLNAEQKIKVGQILEDTRQVIDKEGLGLRKKIIEIRENTDKRIMDLLTPQQQEKFKELIINFKKHDGSKEIKKGLVPKQMGLGLPGELPPPPQQ